MYERRYKILFKDFINFICDTHYIIDYKGKRFTNYLYISDVIYSHNKYWEHEHLIEQWEEIIYLENFNKYLEFDVIGVSIYSYNYDDSAIIVYLK